MRFFIVCVIAVCSANAWAQQYCPPYPLPTACDPRMQGNPVDGASKAAFYRKTDFVHRLSTGDFDFTRYFVSNASAWTNWSGHIFLDPLAGLPKPFGTSSATGLRWWHNLFAMVVDDRTGQVGGLVVRDTQGFQSMFGTCTGTDCWASLHSWNPSERARLRLKTSGPELTRPDGTLLRFQSLKTVSGRPVWFLTSIVGRDGNDIAVLTYFGPTEVVKLPPTWTTQACGSGDMGIPFIKQVAFASASNTKLLFSYGPAGSPSECVLKAVDRQVGTGALERLVRYDFGVGSGVPELIAMANLSDGGVAEVYSYASNHFTRLAANGASIEDKTLTTDLEVTTSIGNGLQRTGVADGTGNAACTSGPGCCGVSFARQVDISLQGEGGNGGVASVVRRYTTSDFQTQMRSDFFVTRIEDTSTSQPAYPIGFKDFIYLTATGTNSCSNVEPGSLWAVRSKTGAFSATPWQLVTPGVTSLPTLEQTQRLLGATNHTGTGHLQKEEFAYDYSPTAWQRPGLVKQPSALVSGADRKTITRYFAGTNRVFAVVQTGKTRVFGGGTPDRVVGTFYSTSRTCTNAATDSTFNRTLRVEGPCLLDLETSLSCSTSLQAIWPVTEFEYHQSGPDQGRLFKVYRYPSGSGCGTPLVTTFSSYSPQGQPTSVTDESGAVTTYTYTGEQLLTSSIGGETIRNEYVGEKLVRRITEPRGNYERFCYQVGASDSCSGGTASSRLQWRAKYDAAGTWTERIEYTYSTSDGSLKGEIKKVKIGTAVSTRLDTSYSRLLDGPVTKTSYGNAAQVVVRSAVDGEMNKTAVSVPFNPVSDFCATNGDLCKRLRYDRANRLTELKVDPTTTPSDAIKTCLEYDQQGHLRRMTAGCSSTASCADNVSANQGTNTCAPAVDYEVDDFDNVVSVTTPWTVNPGGPVKTEYQFNADGTVERYRTQQMAANGTFVKNIYDQLGRLTERQSVVAATTQTVTLFRLGYDGSIAPGTNCAALAFAGGRQTFREDSFGKTWLRYNARGQVTREIRMRSGSTCSVGGVFDVTPDTEYTYSVYGELTSIKYPHGRKVSYVYPSTGMVDKPSSIQLTTCTTSGCSVDGTTGWSAPATVIDSIAWEPYGGLRAYRLTAANQGVEYLLEGNLQTLPTATTCATLPATSGVPTDGSGRLRGVFVSSGFTLGSPTGGVFKQVYTWNADQLVDQRTCNGSLEPMVTVGFGYDKMPRLTSQTDGNVTTQFNWSRRDNPTSFVMSGGQACTEATDYFSGAHQLDLHFAQKWGPQYGTTCNSLNPASGKYNTLYDLDGRRTVLWDESTRYKYTLGWSQAANFDQSVDSVYKSATFEVAGGPPSTYSYFYDALARRRSKVYPDSTWDEFFYDLGHQLLSDRGRNPTSNELTEDDYVWLGGRPVMMVKSKFNASTFARSVDNSGACTRNGEAGLCGTYAVVTDYIGKPVLTLENSSFGNISGTASYEAFGFANRREYRWGTAHNTLIPPSSSTTIAPPMPSSFDGPLRVLTSRSNYSASTVTLAGNNENTALSGNRAHTWTNWRYASGNSWTLQWSSGSASDYGLDVEAYEVQPKKAGTWWAWTPLRFPGHYYDAETELNENWNRYLDPRNNRYLSPEPLLAVSRMQEVAGKSGRVLPVFAYAGSNPVKHTDKDGRLWFNPDCAVLGSLALITSEHTAGPHKWDKKLHCVAACYMAKNCGPGMGWLAGYLKESTDAQFDPDDIKANAFGERCAWGGVGLACEASSCEKCCDAALSGSGLP